MSRSSCASEIWELPEQPRTGQCGRLTRSVSYPGPRRPAGSGGPAKPGCRRRTPLSLRGVAADVAEGSGRHAAAVARQPGLSREDRAILALEASLPGRGGERARGGHRGRPGHEVAHRRSARSEPITKAVGGRPVAASEPVMSPANSDLAAPARDSAHPPKTLATHSARQRPGRCEIPAHPQRLLASSANASTVMLVRLGYAPSL